MAVTHVYFLWWGTNVGQSFEMIFIRFIARALEFPVLQGYLIFFLYLFRDFQKFKLIGQTYCVSETGHFEWVFFSSPWAKIEKSEPITQKSWEFWTDCKKKHYNLFRTTKNMCPSHKFRFTFFMVRNKCRAEFKTDFHAVYCKSFRIIGSLLFNFCSGT